MALQDWYSIINIDEIDTPALVVYPDRIKKNIETVKGMIDSVERLRPHVKTFKNKEVAGLMLEAGIKKFKCATIAEAEMLALCHAPDVLLAYQPVGPKLQRLINLVAAYPATKFACLADNQSAAEEIASSALKNNLVINLFIDLNTGMNRTGILPADAFELYTRCAALHGVNLLGLHAYDGHIHDIDLHVRKQKCDESFASVIELQTRIINSGLPAPVIVAGGSPTFPIHAQREGVECSPGTFVYWDKGYAAEMPEQHFLPAALVITRVVSLPGETLLCLDLGHKSIAAEKELDRRVWFINAPQLVMVSQSEEHLVADAGEGHTFKVGDILYGVPYHICPTVALYERVLTVENNTAAGEWKNIARNRKITI